MRISTDETNGIAPLHTLVDQLESLANREQALRKVLLRSGADFRDTRNGSNATQPDQSTATLAHPSQTAGYPQTIRQIQDIASKILPVNATVLVVSKGDDLLLKFDKQTGWHFPQSGHGLYAGHHPADSAAAIDHLEALRAKGAAFLLFPNTAFWWLEHYQDLRQHLDDHYQCIWRDDRCIVYSLAVQRMASVWSSERVDEWLRQIESVANGLVEVRRAVRDLRTDLTNVLEQNQQIYYEQLLHQIREIVHAVLPVDATIAVASRGDELLVKFEHRQGWHFPQDASGVYAGHHPADSAAAIDHLEALRAKGAAFLLFPNTAFWWLEHYQDLRQHLDDHYQCIWRDDRCIVYDLTARAAHSVSRLSWKQLWRQVRRSFVGRQQESPVISFES